MTIFVHIAELLTLFSFIDMTSHEVSLVTVPKSPDMISSV